MSLPSSSDFEFRVRRAYLFIPVLDHSINAFMRNTAETHTKSPGLTSAANNIWRQDPPSEGFDRTVSIYGEIVSAIGFDSNEMFINYQIHVPSVGWNLRKGNTSDGVATSADVNKSDKTAHENFMDAEGMLVGTTQSSCPTSSYRQYTNISPCTRAFLAGFFFIYSCIVVVYDVEYPFWIVSCIALLFLIGSGFPGSPHDYQSVESTASSTARNSRTSNNRTSQPHIDRSPKISHITFDESEYVFNHMICTSFDYKTLSLEDTGRLSIKCPTLFIQAYSKGFLGRIQNEGYGYLHLKPDEVSTSRQVDIALWKPTGDIHANMRDFFIGGFFRLFDEKFVDGLSPYSRTLNKFGVKSVTCGRVRIKYDSIVTDPAAVSASKVTVLTSKPVIARRTVEDILHTFRTSLDMKKLSLKPSSSSLLSSVGVVGSISSSRSSLPRESKQDRIADILARTKAKVRASKSTANEATEVNLNETGSPLHLGTLLQSELARGGRQGGRYESSDDEDEESSLLSKKKSS